MNTKNTIYPTIHRQAIRSNDSAKQPKANGLLDLTLSIGIIYFALSVLVVLVPFKDADAGFSQKQMDDVHNDFLTTLTAVGRGELTWLGFSIYHASLWTRTGKFQNIKDSAPIALSITYQKNIDSDDLAERTVEEWDRLGIFETEERVSWGQRLKEIWPNVKPGDSIITLVTADNVTRFYHNDSILTVLDDPKFGEALLSIWLDPNTSEPELREKLIGQRGEE